MAFVKMTNLLSTVEIPSGAVEAYKNLGFIEVAEEATDNQVSEPDNGNDEPELTEDEKFVLSIEKKPLQQWNKDEVKQYAAIKEIDLVGTKNAQEAKERIKAYMDGSTE